MHIVEGVLAPEILLTGGVVAVTGTAIGLKRLDIERIPVTGVLSAAFFVASLIHVPMGISNAHLVLNGLAGLVLGWAVFPAVLVGLLLQSVFFGFGGLTVLGINLVNIALPGVIVFYLCRAGLYAADSRRAAIRGAAGGGGAAMLTAIGVALSLAANGDAFLPAAKLVAIAHLPVAGMEAAVTGAAVYLIHRVKPEAFGSMATGLAERTRS